MESSKGKAPSSTPELRRQLRAFHQAHQAAFHAWEASGYEPQLLLPIFPEALRGLPCGAKTRSGTPCKLTSIYKNGRCKLHGGLSTGPTSAAGKSKAAGNGRKPKRKRTP